MRKIIIATGCFLAVAQGAWANSGNVGTSVVTKGKASFEARLSYDDDERTSRDNRLDTRVHYDYGVTDSYAVRIVATQRKNGGDNLEHSDLRFENRFQLFEAEKDGWDGGFRLEYVAEDGANGADQARLRLTAATQVEDWYYRTNLFFKHDVGAEAIDGLGTELRWQALKQVEKVKIGIEGFHNVGKLNKTEGWETQSHQIGLVMKAKVNDDISIQTGYQHGISRAAPDHSVKLFVVQKFNAANWFDAF